MNQYMCYFSII